MSGEGSCPEITERLADTVGASAEDVQQEYERFYQWMITEGKKPRRGKPLRPRTARNYVKRLDRIHRQIIIYCNPEEKTTIRADDADDYLFLVDRGEITMQNGDEYRESSKRKLSNALQKYFEWRYHEESLEYEWQPQIKFSETRRTKAYRFTYEELGRLLNAAASYGSLPSYYSTSEEERDRISGLVAQRLGIPKDDVTREDWLRADQSTKIHSMVAVGYDAGLTPIEIGNAEVSWYDPQRQTFRIPTDKACKQREKEEVALADETADALSRWIKERRHLEQYDGTSNLWLNRDGNHYSSGNLCYLIRRLCEEAEITTEEKEIRWYSLRYTMGRNLTEEGELSEANDQLRHKHLKSTKEYDDTPINKLNKRINRTHEKAANAAADPGYDPYAESNTSDRDSTVTTNGDGTPRFPDEVVTRVSENTIHTDAEIPDTPEARIDITRKILDHDDEK